MQSAWTSSYRLLTFGDCSSSEYTPEEDRLILEAQARLGNRWSAIAAMLPGRTEDAVKIRWKSLCRVRKGYVCPIVVSLSLCMN